MTTFTDTARRGRPVRRRAAGQWADAPVPMPRPRLTQAREEAPQESARFVSHVRSEDVDDRVGAGDGARRSGEWVWLTSVAIFTFLIVMLVGLFGLGDAPTVGGDTTVVEVRTGDTLWEIATRVAPDSDPRSVVAEIVELNRLDATAVQTGRLLRVPTGR